MSLVGLTFRLGGHAAFFGIAAELKEPRDFPKAICLLQSIDISLYLITSVVIYRYAGVDVESPALGSAGPVVKRVAYGVALPTVCISESTETESGVVELLTNRSLRSSSPVLFMVMWLPNSSTCASLLAQTAYTRTTGLPKAHGLVSVSLYG